MPQQSQTPHHTSTTRGSSTKPTENPTTTELETSWSTENSSESSSSSTDTTVTKRDESTTVQGTISTAASVCIVMGMCLDFECFLTSLLQC